MQQQSNCEAVERPRSRMTLDAVTHGKIKQPLRTVLYGPPGIGKSTFAASAPSPVFLGAEDGTAELDVARFPTPESWADVVDALRTLLREEHAYKTLTIDTLDWIEPMIWARICKEQSVENIEDIGFGKGYVAALEVWRMFLSALERLSSKRDMNIILLAHSHIKTFKDPTSEHYDRYELKLHQKASGLIQEWAKDVLFANYEVSTVKDKQTKRVRGIGDGTRQVHTVRNACWDAKNRHSLPETLPLCWDDYAEAVGLESPAKESEIREAISALLESANDEALTEKVNAAVERSSGAAQLAQVLNRLKAKVSV